MSRFLVGTRGPRVREPHERAAHTTDERAAHPYLTNSNRVTHFPRVLFLCG